eukprot:c10471_g1_i1.p1 GENE.c10471_g1_i1~~c10471_g1_i1.p1  ORF type:complete len:262 (+),score=55.37 c10471_g1_i1:65-787(+)
MSEHRVVVLAGISAGVGVFVALGLRELWYRWKNQRHWVPLKQKETEMREKMRSGELYKVDETLFSDLTCAHRICFDYNTIGLTNPPIRKSILSALIGSFDANVTYIEPPSYCDYGYNIKFLGNFYCNFNCTILDCAPVTIGKNCFLGPNVHLYTAGHPIEPSIRNLPPDGEGLEFAKPITIGDDVWIGGCAVVCPGVTIGNRVTVAAGSVVVHDVESDVVVAGVPARVVKRIPKPEAIAS